MPKRAMRIYPFNKSDIITSLALLILSIYPLAIAYNYPYAYLNDDWFITLTYSKNIAKGNGFVFNHPPATLGTTTPLFALLVALISLVFYKVELSVIAVFFTAFCWISIVWILFLFRRAWGLENWQVCIMSLVILGMGWRQGLGMEAYLFAFLLTLTISLFLSNHYSLAGFTSGLLFLTRGEGILIVPVILVTILLHHKSYKVDKKIVLKKIAKVLLSFAIVFFIWFVYAELNFGHFLPNTLSAKVAQGQSNLWNTFLPTLVTRWFNLWGKRFEPVPGLNFYKIIALLGLLNSLAKDRRWLIWAAWITLYITGYSLLQVAAYGWYQIPIIFVLNIFFGLGLVKIINILIKLSKTYKYMRFLLFIFVLAVIWLVANPEWNLKQPIPGDQRGESYINLSKWLVENTDSCESVAYIEIGYLGYYTNNKIIDLAGLILPEMIPYLVRRDVTGGFWKYSPDYYIYLPDFDWALSAIRADPRFNQEYQPVATLFGPRESNFTIYKRRNPSNCITNEAQQ